MSETDPKAVIRRPHKHQLEFLRSTAKRKIIRAGRRGGKTTGAGILAVEQFIAGHRILYATPTADQIKRFWYEVTRSLAEPIARHPDYYKNESEHIIEIKGTENRIRAKTAWNADTLRGDYADVLILDEWQLMDESAWEEVGAPMLIDNNGDAVFIYTPPSLHSHGTSKARDLQHARKMFKRATEDKSGRWAAFHFTSYENPHLSKEGLNEVTSDMTNLAYRQEIMAEDIDEVPGALWTRDLIERTRVSEAPRLTRIVVGIDPSGSSTNEAGIVVAGIGADGQGYVMRDASMLAPSPKAWAAKAIALYDELKADRIVAERNFGGDMVEETIRNIDENVSYHDVTASRGKLVRAEPICALFERQLVHLVGVFPEMEDEMVSYVPGNPSPNRMDAMVWALTELRPGLTGLGLVDWLKGSAPGAVAQIVAPGVSAPGAVGRPISTGLKRETIPTPSKVSENSGSCPACCATIISQVARGQWRCGQCGLQWNTDDHKPVFGANRSSLGLR